MSVLASVVTGFLFLCAGTGLLGGLTLLVMSLKPDHDGLFAGMILAGAFMAITIVVLAKRYSG